MGRSNVSSLIFAGQQCPNFKMQDRRRVHVASARAPTNASQLRVGARCFSGACALRRKPLCCCVACGLARAPCVFACVCVCVCVCVLLLLACVCVLRTRGARVSSFFCLIVFACALACTRVVQNKSVCGFGVCARARALCAYNCVFLLVRAPARALCQHARVCCVLARACLRAHVFLHTSIVFSCARTPARARWAKHSCVCVSTRLRARVVQPTVFNVCARLRARALCKQEMYVVCALVRARVVDKHRRLCARLRARALWKHSGVCARALRARSVENPQGFVRARSARARFVCVCALCC